MPISDSRKWPSNVRGEMLEREVKLAVDDNFDPAALSGVIGDWEIHRVGETFLEATYYDTGDLRLLRSGMSLRFRDGWLIKLSQPSGQPELMWRLEVPLAGPEGEIPVRGSDLIRAAVRQETVLPVSRISTHRQLFAIRDDDGIDLAEVAFDQVVSNTEAGTAAAFAELEIELDGSASAAVLGPIIARFRALGAGNAIPVSKFARSLGLTIMPGAVVVVPALDARATAGEVVHASIARSVRRLLDHAPAVVLDENPEGVHQARVATRKLRSDLRTFRRLLDREWADRLRDGLRGLTELLGRVRDMDVLLSRLSGLLENVQESEREAAEAICATLQAERNDALEQVIEEFREPSYVELLDRLVEACEAPKLTKAAQRPSGAPLLKLVRKPWQKLRAAVHGLPDQPTPEELHRIRILTKRARYAAEAVAPVGGPAAELFGARLSELQDVLGEHQDAVFAGAWLRRSDSSVAPAAAELIGLEKGRADRAAEAWRPVWLSIDRPELTHWLDHS
ncbi:MAG: CHAD domain-containing protein [Acidimicrobiia bacterium]|nr:CHAD domain-containing protein [Acidimicrobiia bacterium]